MNCEIELNWWVSTLVNLSLMCEFYISLTFSVSWGINDELLIALGKLISIPVKLGGTTRTVHRLSSFTLTALSSLLVTLDKYWCMVAMDTYTGTWLLWGSILVHGFYGGVYWCMAAKEKYTGTWLLWRQLLVWWLLWRQMLVLWLLWRWTVVWWMLWRSILAWGLLWWCINMVRGL